MGAAFSGARWPQTVSMFSGARWSQRLTPSSATRPAGPRTAPGLPDRMRSIPSGAPKCGWRMKVPGVMPSRRAGTRNTAPRDCRDRSRAFRRPWTQAETGAGSPRPAHRCGAGVRRTSGRCGQVSTHGNRPGGRRNRSPVRNAHPSGADQAPGTGRHVLAGTRLKSNDPDRPATSGRVEHGPASSSPARSSSSGSRNVRTHRHRVRQPGARPLRL